MEIPSSVKEIMLAKPNIGRYQLSKEAGISESDARFYAKLFKEQSTTEIKRGIALGDIHYPEQDNSSLEIVFSFMKDFNPDYVLLMGDQMDMDCISFYNKGKPKLTEGKRIKYDYMGFQRKVLDRIDSIVNDDCKKYFFIGNHEYRTTRLIEESPQYEGLIEPDVNLKLDDYIIVPFNECRNIGEMYFMHGMYWNKYHSEKTCRIYGKHIFTWHVHTNQVFTMYSPINRFPRQGVSVGCLCNKNPDY